MPLDDENGCDSETSAPKPSTSSQKVAQNIHNNCGHRIKEELLRALRLSRAQPEVLDYVGGEFECPACAAKGHSPKLWLPAALPRKFRFNETLVVDLFEIESSCWGTLYQLCNFYPRQDFRDGCKVHC